MENENLKILYNETVEIHKYQQQGIDLFYNKLNWILVSDVVFLAGLYGGSKHPNILVVLLISTSILFAFFGFSSRKFKYTAKISKQLNDIEKDNYIKILIDKKRQAFEKNAQTIKEMKKDLIYSQWLFIAAILLQFVLLIIK
jgi:hypothetical protein